MYAYNRTFITFFKVWHLDTAEMALVFINCCCLPRDASESVSVWDEMLINLQSINSLFHKLLDDDVFLLAGLSPPMFLTQIFFWMCFS